MTSPTPMPDSAGPEGSESVGPGVRPLCRCVWQKVHCEKEATQEDGLCDWCGVRRPEDMRDNPFAQFDQQTGKYLGLAGGTVTGYNHQAGWEQSGGGSIPNDVRPTACWMPDSGRTLHCVAVHGLGCARA